MTRHPIIVAAVCVVLPLAGAAAWVVATEYTLKKRIADTTALLRQVAIGVEAEFVDNCGELVPGEDNRLPAQLTTPLGYVSSRDFRDPFSRDGEPLQYYNQEGRGNGTMYVLASRGPDGVLDMANLPERLEMPRPVAAFQLGLKGRDVTLKLSRDATETRFLSHYWCLDVEYFIDSIGNKVTNTSMTVRLLPKDAKTGGWLKREDLVAHLLAQGCTVYDPTNGLRSTGDIIRTNAQ